MSAIPLPPQLQTYVGRFVARKRRLSLFKAAAGPVVPVLGKPDARLAMVQVADAADAIAALAAPGGPQQLEYALCDGVTEGYDWNALLDCAADAVGHRAVRVRVPVPLLRAIGVAGSATAALTGRAVMLTLPKTREITHPNWSVASQQMPPESLWKPRVGLREGFADAAKWYREHRWI